MTISILIPDNYQTERRWIVGHLFDQIFNNYKIELKNINHVEIGVTGTKTKILIKDELIPSLFKNPTIRPKLSLNWIPDPRFSELNIARLPILNSINKNIVHTDGLNIYLEADILGMAFWALSNWDEFYYQGSFDEHNRFLAKNSVIKKYGILEKPWIDQWTLWLKYLISEIFPNLKIKSNSQFLINISHDVDVPYCYAFSGYHALARRAMGDIFKRGDYLAAIKSIGNRKKVINGNDHNDPFYTFDWLMNASESSNLKSTFNFIAAGNPLKIDCDYYINNNRIKNLLYKIQNRGHNIGLHPSYNAYNDSKMLVDESSRLSNVCKSLNFEQEIIYSRNHFLRWDAKKTLQALELARVSVDSTLCFADSIGFRCGTSKPFKLFDLESSRETQVVEQPLIVMDYTLTNSDYMGLKAPSEIRGEVKKIKDLIRDVGGVFSLLWHNHNITDNKSKLLYLHLIND